MTLAPAPRARTSTHLSTDHDFPGDSVPNTITAARDIRPAAPSAGVLTPLGLTESRLADTGFWGLRARVNADATLTHCLDWQERAGWLANFDAVAAGEDGATRNGREFSDSEAYKLLEAYCWENATHPSDELEAVIRSLTARIAAAQASDGYLNTNFDRPGGAARYTDLEWGHELYNYGHLLQAAVARIRTHGDDDELVTLARRVADHVCDTFGDDGIRSVCGHPEIEVGLMEFARATGEERYREQARLFIERRGHGVLADIEWGRSYYQDDIPVREATVLRGHAVRALYLAASVVDLAVETDDAELLAIAETQWENTVARRTYVTGGMGSHHQDEAFGDDFVLPSDRAYCESCAGIASVMFSWRLLLATGKARYADLIERTLFNIVATAPSEDGRSFFYSNTLHRRSPGAATDPDVQSKRADSSQRAAWFDVSCCPNNLARTFASLGGYLATADASGVQIHQFADAVIDVPLEAGRLVVELATRYPDDGEIALTVRSAPGAAATIAVRVPEWAAGATLEVDGVASPVEPGYASVTRDFAEGDVIVLRLPLDVRIVRADARIDAVNGQVAVERGPLVYALESVDLPAGAHVDDVVVDPSSVPRIEGDVIVLDGALETAADGHWPYGSDVGAAERVPLAVPLVPYHRWAERGPATMRIWLRTA
ncbi:glycoside hydrolase family 127 protein [Agromyces atrinae]|uniref:Glycoside hydrolase family 127 protein n=1 Tax=Agromyces atrinae TaxID=592376 RepID=A0A4Q2M6Z5_9MICO|nr:beta-L-arabinofuranosidase domain-containing protein [Agromyces atrinae]NYD68364.1 hypothetical protein [Agromyces atrinae]RXZ85592.1 glycoside hydrolase family 127 protein [Agromyces atrinae]